MGRIAFDYDLFLKYLKEEQTEGWSRIGMSRLKSLRDEDRI